LYDRDNGKRGVCMSPFDYLNAINTTKKDVMVDDITEKAYNSFMVNRSLSYFPDTVLAANEMNIHHQVDSRLQFDFLINIIRKRKRFSKWDKKKNNSDVEVIKEYYGYNEEKALQVLNIISTDQLNELHKKVYKGGRK
jgi:predicted CopG family antitoxin